MKAANCVTLLVFLSLCVQRRMAQAAALPDPSGTDVCPPTEDGVLGSCGITCEQDEECTNNMTCCPNTCGTKSCTKIDYPITELPLVSGNKTTVRASSASNYTFN
ncbi:waprin-Thr1-like [Bufo bufo]|uniref:waprin-Thr1-like n=1 Tax=Bufo bufo TaxID=8384 RepID=UPI001ABDDC73|nr:waprin-Thr1-like [Bufo bufo]